MPDASPITPPLRLYRVLLLAGGLMLVGVGGLYQWSETSFVDPLAGRISLGTSALAFVALTFTSQFIRRHALALTYVFFFLISAWQLAVAAAAGLTSASAFGVILVFLGCSAGMQSTRLLAGYTAAFLIGAVMAAFWAEAAEVPRGAFLVTIGAIGALGVFVSRSREASIIRLDAARKEALGAARAKSEFLAAMSHEIRTPLNGVIGMTDLLAGTRLTADQRDALSTIQASGRALLSVINDVLDFSKIEAGHLEIEPEPVHLRSVADDAVAVVASVASERGVEVVCHVAPGVPARVMADGARLRQVVLNLLSNAVKFTDSGSVTLSVDARRRRGTAELTIAVADTGIGIAEADQLRLFDAFTQADTSTTRRFGGTGLGLAISKRIVEAMGGTLAVESTVGEGATFTLVLSVDEVEGPPEPSLAGTLLIVDDHDGARAAVTALADTLGLAVRPFATAEEALAFVEEGGRYDLAALDLTLPGDGAFSLAESLRRGPMAGRPLLLLAPLGTRVAAASLFDAVLSKPVRTDRLSDVVARLTGVAPEPEPLAPVVASDASLRVLLVEDHEINRKVALGLLDRLGLSADVALNGEEGVAAVAAAPYDLVLMDVQMPVMDGLEATRRIREMAPETRPRIVALTANAMTDDVSRCLAAGMDSFLSKPVRLADLRTEIEATRGSAASPAPPDAASFLPTAPDSGSASGPPIIPAPTSVVAHLRALADGDDVLAVEILEAFLRTAPVLAAELTSDAAAGAAHKLKAAFGTLGADALAHAAFEVEQILRTGSAADTGPLADGLARFSETTIEALALLREPETTASTHNA